MKPLPLTAEAEAVLARIRTSRLPLAVCGTTHARTWPQVKDIIRLHVNAAGAAVSDINKYMLCAQEMAKAFRTETGEPLARELVLTIRKWAGYGLKPALLQTILCDCVHRFEQLGYSPEPARPRVGRKPGPKSRRLPRRTYEQVLRKGRVALNKRGTVEDQAAGHAEAIRQNREISNTLSGLLKARKVPGREFVRYNAFAQKLGRLARNYHAKSLAIAATELVDLYEANGLDRATVLSIALVLFDITELS
jgi:hypothetical protein